MKKLSKCNLLERNKSSKETVRKYSFRKLTTGALASVAVGAFFLNNSTQVSADTVKPSTKSVRVANQEENLKNYEEPKQISNDNKATDADNNFNSDNTNVERDPQKNVTQVTAKNGNLQQDTITPNKENEQNKVTGSKDVEANKVAESNSNKELSVTNSIAESADNADKQAEAASKTTTDKSDKNDWDTKEHAVAKDDDHDVYITMSKNTLGNDGSNDQNRDLFIKLHLNGKLNDTMTMTIPKNITYDVNVEGNAHINASSDFDKNTGVFNLTYDKNPGNVVVQFRIYPYNNGQNIDGLIPSDDIGKHQINIDWTYNDKKEDSFSFEHEIQPSMSPTTLTRENPPKKDQEGIIPNADYIYSFRVNENRGSSIENSPLGRVNSTVNYGTTITIPTPEGFVLDEDVTKRLNAFTDQTTITQGGKGNDVVISVPKNSGTQVGPNDFEYKIVGYFDVKQTKKKQTLKAKSGIKVEQKLDDKGTNILKATGPAWEETIAEDSFKPQINTNVDLGIGGAVNTLNKNHIGSTKTIEINKNSTPIILNTFGFKNVGTRTLDNNTDLIITFPEEFRVTKFTTGIDQVNIPNLTKYSYTMTLANGKVIKTTIDAGKTIEAPDSYIKSITLTPNEIKPGDFINCGDYTHTDTLHNFAAWGTVVDTKDNGEKVKSGYKVTTDYSTVTRLTNETIFAETQNTQTLWYPNERTAKLQVWGWQASSESHTTDSISRIAVYQTGDSQADSIYEPILYYVLPKNASYSLADGIGDPNQNLNPEHIDPKVTSYLIGDRQVVKLDYSNTGCNFNVWGSANTAIHLNNIPDAPNGIEHWEIYAVSPKTKMANQKYSVQNKGFAAGNDKFDPNWVEGNTDNLYFIGSGDWRIQNAGELSLDQMAQGNKDAQLSVNGNADDKQGNDITFALTLNNRDSASNLKDTLAVIDLPTANDENHNQFTFRLDQEAILPDEYKKLGIQFLYSTEASGAIKTQEPNLNKYETADQVKDWKKIKSIIIKLPEVQGAHRIGRILLKGKDENILDDAGKSSSLHVVLYPGSAAMKGQNSVYDSNDKSALKSATVTISGKSTIHTRLHYIDENGKNNFIDLNNDKTYRDNVDNLNKDDFSRSIVSDDIIPKGYELVDDPIITDKDGNKLDEVILGSQMKARWHNAYVQFELEPKNYKLNYQIVDEDADGEELGNGLLVAGRHNSNISANVKKNLDDIVNKYTNDTDGKYQLVSSYSIPDKFTDNDQTIVIHLKHRHDGTVDDKSITRTIHVIYEGKQENNKTIFQTVNFTRQVDKDLVTGKTNYGDWTINGKNSKWDEYTVKALKGYIIKSIKSDNNYGYDKKSADISSKNIKFSDKDENVYVIITPQLQSTTIRLVDDDNRDDKGNPRPVGDSRIISGYTNKTVDVSVPKLPEKYQLVENQDVPNSYTFKTENNEPIIIHLKHRHDGTIDDKSITRTIHVIYEGKQENNKTIFQTVNFTRQVDKDLVTGKTKYGDWTINGKNSKWDKFLPETLGNYYIDSIKSNNFDYDNITKNQDGKLAGVAECYVDAKSNNENVVITLKDKEYDNIVKLVDGDDNNKVLSNQPIHGKAGDTVHFTVTIPKHYVYTGRDEIPSTYTFKSNGNEQVIIVVHHDFTVKSESKEVTRKVHIIYEDNPGKSKDILQTVNFTRDNTQDLVTGKVTHGYWRFADANHNWKAVLPNIPDGYKIISVKNNDGQNYKEVIRNNSGKVVAINEVTPEFNTSNEDVTILMAPIMHRSYITVVDLDSGKELSHTDIQGKTNETVNVNYSIPDGYELVKGEQVPKIYIFDANQNDPILIIVKKVTPQNNNNDQPDNHSNENKGSYDTPIIPVTPDTPDELQTPELKDNTHSSSDPSSQAPKIDDDKTIKKVIKKHKVLKNKQKVLKNKQNKLEIKKVASKHISTQKLVNHKKEAIAVVTKVNEDNKVNKYSVKRLSSQDLTNKYIKELPQTGEEDTNLNAIGLVITSIAGILGFASDRKRKN